MKVNLDNRENIIKGIPAYAGMTTTRHNAATPIIVGAGLAPALWGVVASLWATQRVVPTIIGVAALRRVIVMPAYAGIPFIILSLFSKLTIIFL